MKIKKTDQILPSRIVAPLWGERGGAKSTIKLKRVNIFRLVGSLPMGEKGKNEEYDYEKRDRYKGGLLIRFKCLKGEPP